MLVAVVNSAILLADPPEVVTFDRLLLITPAGRGPEAAVVAEDWRLVAEAAYKKALGGNPPSVSASPAFSA